MHRWHYLKIDPRKVPNSNPKNIYFLNRIFLSCVREYLGQLGIAVISIIISNYLFINIHLSHSLEKDGEYVAVAECLLFVSNDLESVFTHSILGGFTQ